ncbi:MAG TPA: hypothetical protein DCS43_04815 [Verrucomicrobia bacterium]|nr:hypothetical protein [Verrucomicrobiota bacterium]
MKSDGFGKHKWFLLAVAFLGINFYGVMRLQPDRVPSVLPAAEEPPVITNTPPTPPPTETVAAPATNDSIRLHSVLPVDIDDEGWTLLELKFNHALSPSILEKFLTVADGNGRPCEFRVQDRQTGEIMQVAVSAEAGSVLVVTIAAGLHAEYHPHPLDQPLRWTLQLSEGLSLTDLSIESPSFEQVTLRVRFSQPVDIAGLRRALRFEPAVEFSITERQEWWRGMVYDVRGAFQKGRNYTIHVDEGVKATAGGARLEKALERTLFVPDSDPAMRLSMAGRYLSPQGSLLLPLESVNVNSYSLRTARLPAHNLVQFAMREGGHYSSYQYGDPADDISITATSQTYTVKAEKNAVTPHVAPLRGVLPADPRGAWVVDVMLDQHQRADRRLLVITDTGITVRQNGPELLVWANSIHTLEAVTGATVSAWSPAAVLLAEGTTDAEGLATLALPGADADPFMVSVANGDDLAFLSLRDTQVASFAAAATIPYLQAGVEAFVYTDRGIYRPGETTHLRGIVRARHLQVPQPHPVELRIIRPDGRLHSSQQGMLSALGTVEFSIPWADYDATGRYRLILQTPGAKEPIGDAVIAVEEFVPPRMAVSASTDKTAYGIDEKPLFSISARYLYGAVAAGNAVNARLQATPADFTSAQFPDYQFGDSEKSLSPINVEIGKGSLTGEGTVEYRIPFASTWQPPAKLQAMAVAQVMEQGGRTIAATASFDIHPYPYYIGLRGRNLQALKPADTARVELVLVNPDGNPLRVVRKLEFQLSRVEWSSTLVLDGQGRYRYESNRRVMPIRQQSITTAEDGTATLEAVPDTDGNFLLQVSDTNSSTTASLSFYAGSGHHRWQSRSMEEPDRVELSWDKPRYLPGDVARLTIKAPFAGKALLTLEQDRLLSRQVKMMDSNTTSFDIPVTDEYRPNAHASVSVIRPVKPSSLQEVYRAVGSLPLLMEETPLRVNLGIQAPTEIRPGSRLELDLQATDADGNGVASEIAVALVDEGICMLTSFRTPDPAQFFNALRFHSGSMSDLYAMLLPESDPETSLYSAQTGGDDMQGQIGSRLNPIKSRRFKPVALWQGGVPTDDQGRCRVGFDIPEFTGSLRVMAVAVTPSRFGSAAQAVTVRRPFTVLSSLPRFLAPGDTCTMPVELYNTTDREGEALLAVTASGPVSITPSTLVPIVIKAGGRASLSFEVTALQQAGNAHIELTGTLHEESVKEHIELPVRPPSAPIRKYGSLALPAGDKGSITLPKGWLENSATFTVQTMALPAPPMAGALNYLARYPYGCLEQTTSSSFPLLYIEELQSQTNASSYIADTTPMVRRGINRILSMQTGNGGFGWWPGSSCIYEWGSVYAMHFLVEAGSKGHSVPEIYLESGLGFLRQLLTRPVKSPDNLATQTWRDDAALRAYACYVLALHGTPRNDWTARLREQHEYMTTDSRLHLVMALAAGGRRRDAFEVLQALEAGPLRSDQDEGEDLSSPTRMVARQLMAWLELAPDDARVFECLREVETRMTDGCWRTTQENAVVLMALSRYMQHASKQQKHFAGQIQQGTNTTEVSSTSPTNTLRLADGSDLNLVNQGPGTLYANWYAEGVPMHAETNTLDRHISIRRTLHTQNGETIDGNTFKQGDLQIVRLEVNTHGRSIDNLVIEDLLPGGFEIENTTLATSQPATWGQLRNTLPVRHLEIRDDRILVFLEAFNGSGTFYYAVRAVTPGQYIRPPVSVTAMYNPEIHSRHDSGTIIVEEAGQ